MVRYLLLFVVAMLLLRAFWRMLSGLIDGAAPPVPRRQGPPERGVQMVRDPVCGTFLPPGNALNLVERGGAVHYFCSDKCREAFKARV